jgi:HD-like signal output (HDOD) protein
MLAWFRNLFSDAPPERRAAPSAAPASAAEPVKPRHFASDSVSALQYSQVDFLFAGWLFEAEDYTEIFTSPTEDAILAALDAVVKSERSGTHLVQRMPGVIPQLLQSLRNEEFSGAEVARKIEHDLVLVAEVLRLANSAAYGPGQAITSIDHAVLMLGHDGLRQLITSVAFKPIINLNSGSFTRRLAPRLWSQSERCALACRMLAGDCDLDPIDAFLAGLIQNIGLTVSLRVIDRMAQQTQQVGSPTFCNALAAHGRILACNIAREWHFPDAVTNAIHEQNANVPAKDLSPLGRVLRMGDYLSKIDTLARRRRLDPRNPEVLDGLSDGDIVCLRELAAVEERDWAALAAPNARDTVRAG